MAKDSWREKIISTELNSSFYFTRYATICELGYCVRMLAASTSHQKLRRGGDTLIKGWRTSHTPASGKRIFDGVRERLPLISRRPARQMADVR